VEQEIQDTLENSILTRPRTADGASQPESQAFQTPLNAVSVSQLTPSESVVSSPSPSRLRPTPERTGRAEGEVNLSSPQKRARGGRPSNDLLPSAATTTTAFLGSDSVVTQADLIECKTIRLHINTTWGDAHYAGLCGIQLLVGMTCVPVALDAHWLSADPADLSSIGCYDDPRVLKNLVNGINCTADGTNVLKHISIMYSDSQQP
jgi:hypothetical protein